VKNLVKNHRLVKNILKNAKIFGVLVHFGEKNAPIGEFLKIFHRAETQYPCGFRAFLVKSCKIFIN